MQACRCIDVQTCRYVDVQICRCVDVQMFVEPFIELFAQTIIEPFLSRNEVRRLCERRSIDQVHDRILHEGAKRCEGTSTLYTVGCQGSLRAARPESVTINIPFLLYIRDIDKLGVKLNNFKNILIQGDNQVPIIYKQGHF